MDIQGQIIALLQGDLRNRADVAQLMRALADSPGEIDIFLRHIDLSRRFLLLGRAVPSAAGPARRALDERIAEFEVQRGAGIIPIIGKRSGSSRSQTARTLSLIGLVLAAMASSLGIGYMIGARNPAATHSATVSDNPAHRITIRPEEPKEQGNGKESGTPAPLPTAPLLHKSVSPPEPQGDTDSVRSSIGSAMPLSESLSESLSPDASLSPLPPDKSALPATITAEAPEQRPPLTLLAPYGGELFRSGDIVPVAWYGSPVGSPMKIELSRDGGTGWQTLARDVRGERFLWTIPEEMKSGSEYLLKVRPDLAPEEATEPLDLVVVDTEGISVDLSRDGRYLGAAGRDMLFTLWDRRNRETVFALRGHSASIQSCRFNADGTKAVTSALDGTAIIWNIAEGRAEQVLDGNKGANVWWAAFSPDGETVATCHDEGTVILWNAATGAERLRLHPHREGVRYAEFTADGTRLLTASTDRTACITDVQTGERIRQFVHNTVTPYVSYPNKAAMSRAIVNAIQLTADGTTAITCGLDGDVKFWDVRTGELIRTRSYHQGKQVSMVRLAPDNSTLVSIGDDGTMALIDPNTGGVLSRRSLRDSAARDERVPMIHIGIGSDPHTVAVSHTNGRISLWDIQRQGAISGAYWSIKKEEERSDLE